MLGRIRHPNIVTLIGFAFPASLVYELASADLRARLYSESELHWQARLQIAHDISKGLAFLQGCLFHRGIKLEMFCSMSTSAWLCCLKPPLSTLRWSGRLGTNAQDFGRQEL